MALQELQCEATPHLLSRRRSPPRGLPSTNSPAAPHQQSSLCTTTRTLVPQPPLASPQLAHLLLQELRTPSLQQTEATQSWPLQHQPLNTSSQLPHHLHQPSRTHPLRQSLQAARDTSAQPRRRTSPSPDLPRASSSPPQPELSLHPRHSLSTSGARERELSRDFSKATAHLRSQVSLEPQDNSRTTTAQTRSSPRPRSSSRRAGM